MLGLTHTCSSVCLRVAIDLLCGCLLVIEIVAYSDPRELVELAKRVPVLHPAPNPAFSLLIPAHDLSPLWLSANRTPCTRVFARNTSETS
jgi:hypothetical protein